MAASNSGEKSKDAKHGSRISAAKSSVIASMPGKAARSRTNASFRERNASASLDWVSNSEKSAVLTTKVRPDVADGGRFDRVASPLRQTLSGSRPPPARNRSTSKCSPAARRTHDMTRDRHRPGSRAMMSSLHLHRRRVNIPAASGLGKRWPAHLEIREPHRPIMPDARLSAGSRYHASNTPTPTRCRTWRIDRSQMMLDTTPSRWQAMSTIRKGSSAPYSGKSTGTGAHSTAIGTYQRGRIDFGLTGRAFRRSYRKCITPPQTPRE